MSQHAALKALFYPPAGQRSHCVFNSSGNPVMEFPADLLGRLIGANMNTANVDQKIPLSSSKFRLRRILMTNASTSLTTAGASVYTATTAGGVNVVNTQALSGLSAATKCVDLTLSAASTADSIATGALFFYLTTAQGAAATADIYVFGDNLDL